MKTFKKVLWFGRFWQQVRNITVQNTAEQELQNNSTTHVVLQVSLRAGISRIAAKHLQNNFCSAVPVNSCRTHPEQIQNSSRTTVVLQLLSTPAEHRSRRVSRISGVLQLLATHTQQVQNNHRTTSRNTSKTFKNSSCCATFGQSCRTIAEQVQNNSKPLVKPQKNNSCSAKRFCEVAGSSAKLFCEVFLRSC